MNFTGTTIEQLLECNADTLEAMTDSDLDKWFAEALKINPSVMCMEPVADAEPRQTTSLRGARGGVPVKNHKTTRPKLTMEPSKEAMKTLSKVDQLKAKNAALENLMKGLD